MKRTLHLLLLCLLLSGITTAAPKELKEKLTALSGISDIQPVETDLYTEKYVLFIKQPLNHILPEAGTFKQRLIISHVGFDRPTILVTEGYGAAYALSPGYREELSELLNANLVFVEHRYFLESTPQPRDWDYLTVENSAADLHRITTALKQLYPQKWISTGVSKGGQMALIYRAFYPNDVDITVPYVAPVCRAVEDGRHEPFIARIGTAQERKTIETYQREVLKRKAGILPLFKAHCAQKGLTFRLPEEEIYDYCVLEYPFALRQWGTPVSIIPDKSADNETLFRHLLAISEPSYFAQNQANLSFFIQAARELGYYGYDTEPFKKLLTIRSAENYLQRVMLPEGLQIEFRHELYRKITSYLNESDPRIIFIYGANDPWTAAAVTNTAGKTNRLIAIQPDGCHLTRVNTLPKKMKKQVIEQLNNWLKEL